MELTQLKKYFHLNNFVFRKKLFTLRLMGPNHQVIFCVGQDPWHHKHSDPPLHSTRLILSCSMLPSHQQHNPCSSINSQFSDLKAPVTLRQCRPTWSDVNMGGFCTTHWNNWSVSAKGKRGHASLKPQSWTMRGAFLLLNHACKTKPE